MLDWVGIAPLADRIAGTLPYTDERRVAIGRALMGAPRFLLLDEPAAGMSAQEASDLSALVRRIARERGIGVLLIEHNVGLVLGLCDHIVVLDSGAVIETGPPATIRDSEKVRHAYMGTAADTNLPILEAGWRCRDEPSVPLQHLGPLWTPDGGAGCHLHAGRGRDPVHHRAERGGKSSLLRAIAGVTPPAGGRVDFADRDITGQAPEDIARLGLSMVPEGRDVFGSLTIEENLLVGTGMHAGARGWRARAATELEAVYATFPILKDRRHSQAGLLSGGQQQMLVIGRALMTTPRLVAIDEPSLGLAPNITDQVYERLIALRAERKLTLLIVEQSSTRAMMVGGRMMLMRGGEILLDGDARALGQSEAMQAAYFGYGEH